MSMIGRSSKSHHPFSDDEESWLNSSERLSPDSTLTILQRRTSEVLKYPRESGDPAVSQLPALDMKKSERG
jgi:hypothetical protein